MGLGALPIATSPFGESEPGQQVNVAATLRQLWSAVYRNRLLIAGIVAACLLLGVLATMLATPRYAATATVEIDQEATKVLGTEDTQPVSDQSDIDRFLQTSVDVLKSRLVAEQVVNTLGLAGDDRFLVAMGTKPAALKPGRDARREAIYRLLDDNLTVELPRNSRVVDISFKTPDPALSQRIANSYADNFILLNLKRKFDRSAYARGFLQQQLVSAKQRLEDSERAMLDYSRSVGLIDASAGIGGNGEDGQPTSGPRSLVTSDLVALNAAYAQAQGVRLAAQERWQQAQATPMLSLPEVLNNPTVGALTAARAQVQSAYDQERQRHRADFPSLQQMGAQLASYDRQLTRLAGDVRASIRDQYETAAKQEAALRGQVDVLKTATLTEQDKSVRYNILKRETDTNRTLYDGLLQRYKELSAEAGVSSNNVSLVDDAAVPDKPVSPKPLINLALALLAGLVLAGAIVFVREKFDDAVRSPEDVQTKLGLTLVNTVPLLKPGETPQEALGDPRSALSESYAALRTSLELVAADGLPQILLFTSSRSGEGKSTSAYAVARDFARLGKRVVLIDSDLRRPSLHRTLGLANNNGFASVLARHRGLDDVVQPTDTPGLSFLSAGPLPPSPAELLAGASLKIALDTLAQRFDLVVIDGPPVLGLADAVILASHAGGTVFVIEANGSHHGHAKTALRRLQSSGAAILGALLTKYDAKKVGYGYDYGYYAYNYGQDRPADA